jgi:hypothetical protein
MEESTVQMLMGLGVAIVFLLGFLGGYVTNKTTRAKMLRRLRRDDTGLIKMKTKSNRIVTAIQKLEQPTYRIYDKMFIRDKMRPNVVVYEDEVPIIYYNESDARPLMLEDGTPSAMIKEPEVIDLDKATPNKIIAQSMGKEGMQRYELSLDPTGLLAAFLSYDQFKEAELKLKIKKPTFELKDILILGGIAITGYLVYTQGQKSDDIIKLLTDIGGSIKSLLPKTI